LNDLTLSLKRGYRLPIHTTIAAAASTHLGKTPGQVYSSVSGNYFLSRDLDERDGNWARPIHPDSFDTDVQVSVYSHYFLLAGAQGSAFGE